MKPHPGARAVVEWMLREGRHETRMRQFGNEMCRRIVEAGIPLWRGFCAVQTLHPLLFGTAYIWKRGEQGAVRFTATHSFRDDPELRSSPIATLQATRQTIRRRLEGPDAQIEYPLLEEFRSQGATDYVAMPMICSSGEMNSITWMTDRPGGFSDEEIAGLAEIAQVLALVVELQANRRKAHILLDTYLGRRTGERVLSGAITRGSGEAIRAVIWFCDLRGFTALADVLPREKLLALLNEYFEIMAEAVRTEGGEVLKFIGDAMLAIFELEAGEEPAPRCAAALRAALAANAKMAQCNAARKAAGEQEIRFGLALHLGEVTYGNIGAPDRLDFTVIGPAVNHASRLEKLSTELGWPVVTSASFAAACKEPLDCLGAQQLRGVAEPQEVFAPKPGPGLPASPGSQ